jgi:hypothetical protein
MYQLQGYEAVRMIIKLPSPETRTSSVYWVQQNRCILPDDGDRLQSPKRCVF